MERRRLRSRSNRLREKPDFPSPINADFSVQSSAQKYFALPVGQIISISSRRPASDKRGASRSSRVLGAGCDGRRHVEKTNDLRRTAKSCGPDISTLMSSRQRNLPAMVAKTPDHQGDHEGNRKTIAWGMPECFGLPVVTTLVCFFTFAYEAAGAAKHPAFPAPSPVERVLLNDSGAFCVAGMRRRVR